MSGQGSFVNARLPGFAVAAYLANATEE